MQRLLLGTVARSRIYMCADPYFERTDWVKLNVWLDPDKPCELFGFANHKKEQEKDADLPVRPDDGAAELQPGGVSGSAASFGKARAQGF
jgi:hypothetical protein